MATWPSTLPAPQIANYALQTQDNTVRTDMEGGAARVRRRTTATPDEVTLRFLLDATQMATFRTFWEDDWLHGAAWVFLPIKDGRAAATTSKECRPKPATFKATPVSAAQWVLELTVEVRNA